MFNGRIALTPQDIFEKDIKVNEKIKNVKTLSLTGKVK